MIGSWAGELGQTQMMPSEYYQYAVDYNGDGKRNLIRSVPDVLASTANYLTLRLIAELRPQLPFSRRCQAVDRTAFESKRQETRALMAEKAKVCGADYGKSATCLGNNLSSPRVTHDPHCLRIVNVARGGHRDAQKACCLGDVGVMHPLRTFDKKAGNCGVGGGRQ